MHFQNRWMIAGVVGVLIAGCGGLMAQTSQATSAPAKASPLMVSNETMKNLFAAAIKRGNDFWKDGFWVDHRDMYCGGAHTTTMLYYVLAYTSLSNGDRTYLDRVEQHYHWMRTKYWLEREHCWRDPHDVMMNACLAMNVSMALASGAQFLSDDLRDQMEKDLRDTCVYLSRNNTAVLNNDDLRACNQDAISAAALAVASDYFHDSSIRTMAEEKLDLIIRRSEGPFWVEGGVDKDYQSVGDSALGLAADILWDQLTLAKKKRIAELMTRPYATAQLGMEKMRSESTLGFSGEASQASGILARVANPLIARDVLHAFGARQSMRNPWWIFETPAAIFYYGLQRSSAKMQAIPATSGTIGWGGSARLGMRIDEFQNKNGSIDEKIYLTTPDGLAVQFGDVSAWNPQYAYKERYVEKLQVQQNPGGLRYISRGRKVFAWADGQYDYPRIVFGNGPAEQYGPERHASYARIGFVGSQYHLEQTLRDQNKVWAGSVSQEFIALGRSLLFRFSADEKAQKQPDLRYVLTIPTDNAAQSAQTLNWQQGSLWEKDAPTQQMLAVINGPSPRFEQDQIKAFIANEKIRHWIADKGGSFVWAKPDMNLSRAQILIGETPTWAILSVDGSADEQKALMNSLKFASDSGVEMASYQQGGRWYGIIYLAEKTKREEVSLESPAGRLVLKQPMMGMIQVFTVEHNQLIGYFVSGEGLECAGKPIFHSTTPQPSLVSSLTTGGLVYVDVAGGAAQFFENVDGISLFTGETVQLKNALESERFWYPISNKRGEE